MNNNSRGSKARAIRHLNDAGNDPCPTQNWAELFAYDACINNKMTSSQAALVSWANMVRQDGAWDHKPIIGKRFRRKGLGEHEVQAKHLYIAPDGKEYSVYYDVWSNIHYGYVGMACGFTARGLRDGAGLEQIGSDLMRWNWPRRDGTVVGLQSFDDPGDRAAIQIGTELYLNNPMQLAPAELLSKVVTDPMFAKSRAST